jgi:hypothetical protein
MFSCWLRYCPADDPQNLKALYRRGQAYAALQQHAQAAQDLEGSLQLSGHDPQQQQLIREKLQSVREKLAAEQQQPQLQQNTAGAGGAAAAAAKKQEEDGLIEEVQEETHDEMPPLDEDVPELEVIGELPKQQQQQQHSSRSAAAQQRAAAASGSSSSGVADGGGLAAMQAQAAEMMRANPGLARQVRGTLAAGEWRKHQQHHTDSTNRQQASRHAPLSTACSCTTVLGHSRPQGLSLCSNAPSAV